MDIASGYTACIFADTHDEADRAELQIKRVSAGVDASTLREAAIFFSLGEPVQPFQAFSVAGVGDNALGETIPGVAFIVFDRGNLLVYAGAGSTSLSADALRAGVTNLAIKIDAGL
ncbi:MAG: hypothetical protein WB804_13415 [Candidatus Dormiibacterota bacterium]